MGFGRYVCPKSLVKLSLLWWVVDKVWCRTVMGTYLHKKAHSSCGHMLPHARWGAPPHSSLDTGCRRVPGKSSQVKCPGTSPGTRKLKEKALLPHRIHDPSLRLQPLPLTPNDAFSPTLASYMARIFHGSQISFIGPTTLQFLSLGET